MIMQQWKCNKLWYSEIWNPAEGWTYDSLLIKSTKMDLKKDSKEPKH